MSGETLPGDTRGRESAEAAAARTEASIGRLRALGIATTVLHSATEILDTINAGIQANYSSERAEAIYRTQMANIYERGGVSTADAFADATLRAARNVITTQRTNEALAAARLMIERMADELDRQRSQKSKVPEYAIVAVAALAVAGAVYYHLSRKTRPNPSTRRRRSM